MLRHLKAQKDLRNNDELIITRPDKGRVMNRTDYANKMLANPNGEIFFTKFEAWTGAHAWQDSVRVLHSLVHNWYGSLICILLSLAG